MTMDRAHNMHQQQHGFQQTPHSHHHHLLHNNHHQQQPPPPPLPPPSNHHHHHPHHHIPSVSHVIHEQSHLQYRPSNQRHSLLDHHNHHQGHNNNIPIHENNTTTLNVQPPSTLNRPVHPPPPPPPSNLQTNHNHLATQQSATTRYSPQATNEEQLSVAAANIMRNSLPAVPTRSGNIPIDIVTRNSLQQHNYYVDTHFQYYQPPTLRQHLTHHHLDNIDHSHSSSSHPQQVLLNNVTTNNAAELVQRTTNSNGSASAVDQIDSIHDADNELVVADVNHNQQAQDHYIEEVIQAILAGKEALEKPIEERDDRDILLIDNLCSLVHGFDAFPKSVRRALAAQAVLIVIDERGKELIVHNEELDSFCVLIFGECEQLNVEKTMPIRYYNVGDAFGVLEPTTETIRFVGYMVTRCENCAFLCIKRDDFYTILTDPANYPNKEILRHRDRNGQVVCVSQYDINKKSFGPLWSYHMQSNPYKIILPDGHSISKATEECLLTALVDGYDRIDQEYIDDFLLLFRVFMTYDKKEEDKRLPPGMIKLCLTLEKWLDNVDYRDKVVKIILTWLSSYYHDFELNSDFSYLFFRVMESRLLNLSMNNQLHLLHVTLSAKSKPRHVSISRPSTEQPLMFSISGGYEKNCGIFVTQVNGSSSIGEDRPYDALMFYLNPSHLLGSQFPGRSTGPMIPPRHHRGPYNNNNNSNNTHHQHLLSSHSMMDTSKLASQLRPGDQILEFNGTNFAAITLVDAQKLLGKSTTLSLTVKYNPSAFHEMRALPEGRRKSSLSSVSSVSPYPSSQQKFTFNLHEQQSISNRNGNEHLSNNHQHPPISPLFSANANFGFRSLIKTGAKNTDRLRLSHLINSSKQFVKQIRDSTTSSSSNNNNNHNAETASKASDNISDDQSSHADSIAGGKSKSSSDLVSLRGKDKQIESGLSNVVVGGGGGGGGLNDLNPSSITQNNQHQSNQQSSSNQTLVNVLRVFNAANNDFRYLLVHEETTAREVVMVAVREFNLTAGTSLSQTSPGEKTSAISSLNWQLCEVSVVPESRTIMRKIVPEQQPRLADRPSLCSRFYIESKPDCTGQSSSRLDMGNDSLVDEILKESPPHVTLTSLNATLLAVELTLSDFDKFRSIEPQQFVYDTFFDCSDKRPKMKQSSSINGSISSQDTVSLRSSSSDGQHTTDTTTTTDSLQSMNKTRVIPTEWLQEYRQFADISNREMFWVICEILNERNIGRRVKIVKQFVRVADVCSQLRNYNSMFAIISGLGHSCVSRLKRTFEKLKPKYKNQLEKMRSLFDPSKNMSNYRMCLSNTQPPAIPLFPQIKKDLTFTKEGRSIFVRETNEFSDDDDDDNTGENFSQNTIRRATGKTCRSVTSGGGGAGAGGVGGDLLSVKSAVTIPAAAANNNNNGVNHHLPVVQTRSISHSSFASANHTNHHHVRPDTSDNVLVNFAEIRQFTERVRNVIYYSSVPYSNDLLTNTKDGSQQRTPAQIKKMHEEWQMRKRIRHYMSQTLDGSIVDQQRSSAQTSLAGGSADKLDQVDSGGAIGFNGIQQQQTGSGGGGGGGGGTKLSITYDERTLYQRSLEVEPEVARPQVNNEPRQAPLQFVQSQPPPLLQSNNNNNHHHHHHQTPQVPPTAALMNMQPPPLPPQHQTHHQQQHSLAAGSIHHHNSSPTLSKSSSLSSSCSSFSQQHLQNHYHVSSCTGTRLGSGGGGGGGATATIGSNLNSINSNTNLSSGLTCGVGKFGTESSESLRKLRLLSENASDVDCRRSSYSSNTSRDNGLNKISSVGGAVGLTAKNLISSRIFPLPKTNGNTGGCGGSNGGAGGR